LRKTAKIETNYTTIYAPRISFRVPEASGGELYEKFDVCRRNERSNEELGGPTVSVLSERSLKLSNVLKSQSQNG
jgi:hypothetical protein